ECARRHNSSPAVSSEPTSSMTVPNTGPASISRTTRNVVAPASSSPARMVACTGADPRHAGNSEKCRFTQPCTGISRVDFGINPPYATTGQASGAISRSRCWNSSSPGRSGASTSRPYSSAHCPTGLRRVARPLPDGASGLVTTAATSWEADSSNARNDGTAGSGVPANTRRIDVLLCSSFLDRSADQLARGPELPTPNGRSHQRQRVQLDADDIRFLPGGP